MPSSRQEVGTKFLDGERHVPHGLGCVDQEEHASIASYLCNLVDRLDRPRDVRDVSKRNKLGVGSDRRADAVRIDPSVRITGDSSDTNAPPILEPTERTQDGVVLGGRRDHMVVASEDAMDREIEGVSTVECKNYLTRASAWISAVYLRVAVRIIL